MTSASSFGADSASTAKTVLITGASSGIGLQLAHHYLRQGWQVIACGRNEHALQTITGAIALAFDVSDYQQVIQAKATVAKVLDEKQLSLDLVILNAGTCEYIDDAHAFDGQLFARVIQTNLIAAGYCLDAFLPLMVAGSRVALMSSSATYLPFPRAEAYGASKAGVSYLASSLSVDLAASGIGVSVICPGFVKTPLTDKNDFVMPMRVDAETAAATIAKGLAAGRREIHFPRRFTYLLKLASLLPASLLEKMLRPRSNKAQSKDVK